MTSEDVKFTWETARNVANGSAVASQYALIGNVETPGPQTAVVTSSAFNPGYLDQFPAILPRHATGNYLQRTADGCILFGAYRARYPLASRITGDLDRMEDVFAHARRAARVWFPAIEGYRCTHALGRRLRRSPRPDADDGVQTRARRSRSPTATLARASQPRTSPAGCWPTSSPKPVPT